MVMELFRQNTGVGCHSLLQGIFLTQELNQDLLYAGRFFTIWATMEALEMDHSHLIYFGLLHGCFPCVRILLSCYLPRRVTAKGLRITQLTSNGENFGNGRWDSMVIFFFLSPQDWLFKQKKKKNKFIQTFARHMISPTFKKLWAREVVDAYVWVIHFSVLWKLTQHC